MVASRLHSATRHVSCGMGSGRAAPWCTGEGGLRATPNGSVLVPGCEDPEVLADQAIGRLRAKRDQLVLALNGLMGEHQRFTLAEQLRHIEELNARVERLDGEIGKRMEPFEGLIGRLDGIPGVGRRGAEEILAEGGVDMSRFPTSGHLASWATMCPGNNESGGRRRSGKTRKGNPWLKST